VTATVPVPGPFQPANGYGADMVAAARNGTVLVTGFGPDRNGQRIYRFRLTSSGQVSGFTVVLGGVRGNRRWQADAMAASPDGTQVAVAFYYAGPSSRPHPDYIVDVNPVTGAEIVWRGSGARPGSMFSVASLSWTGDSRELVFLGQWCRAASGPADSESCGGGAGRIAEVRALDPAAGGGRLSSGRLLLGQSARFPYLAQAVISPDGSVITAVDLTGRVQGSRQVSDFLPGHLSVVRISVATGRLLAVLCQRRLGAVSGIMGAPDCLILCQDVAGTHWLLDSGLDGFAGNRNGFNGWSTAGGWCRCRPRTAAPPPRRGDRRLPGRGAQCFRVSPAVMLGQRFADLAWAVGDRALADLAAHDRKLGDGDREVAGTSSAHRFMMPARPGGVAAAGPRQPRRPGPPTHGVP
jgi:hypothetical protein